MRSSLLGQLLLLGACLGGCVPASSVRWMSEDVHPVAVHGDRRLERARIWTRDTVMQWRAVLIRFAIKEAAYKAIHPHLRRFVGFQEAEVDLTAPPALRIAFKPGEPALRLDRPNGGSTDVMLHAFHVMINDALIQTEQSKKIGLQFVPVDNFLGEILACCGQDQPAIFFVFQKPFGIESLDHVGNAGLRNLQRRGDIDDTSVAFGINQLENSFKIILNCGGTAEGGLRSLLAWHAAKIESPVK